MFVSHIAKRQVMLIYEARRQKFIEKNQNRGQRSHNMTTDSVSQGRKGPS